MALTVRILLPVLIVYLGCDHCSDCKPNGKAATGRNSMRRIIDEMGPDDVVEVSELDKTPVCGRRYVVKDALRREVSDDDNSTDDIDDDSHLDKIFGGNFATYGEFPWMANILFNYNHYCGGGIISEYWIITAAHCLEAGIHDMYTVVVGDHTLGRQDKYEAVFKVDQMILHSEYHTEGFDYDIGLIKVQADNLGRGIQFNAYVQPFCLPYATDRVLMDSLVTITGWGNADTNGDQSTILKKVNLHVIWHQNCLYYHLKAVTENMFCVKSKYMNDTAGTTCKGDSGGPVFAQSDVGAVLYGLVIFGGACDAYSDPPVMLNLPKFRGWIDSQIRQNSIGLQGLMPTRRFPYIG